jgi:flagellar hook-associated protein 2
MAQITSSVGLISGINTGALINDLIQVDSEPVTLLQTDVQSNQNKIQAYSTLESSLNDMQSIGNSLALPQTFQNATATSSDPSVIAATTSVGAALGTYQFQVAQLVSTQQSISQGFANSTNSLVGAGTITLEEGGGEASSQTPLSELNGGAGVPQGEFRITDRAGNSAVIDASSAITLDDVVTQINSALGLDVQAAVTNQGLVLTDSSGGTGSLSVQDINGGTTAQSLGIATSVDSNTLTGTNINYISTSTALSQLNDGNGVSTTTAGQNDFTITARDGTAINVSLNGAATVGDVINAINTAGGAKLKASISASGTGITLTDTSGGTGALTVTADNGSQAAADLGLTTAATGSTLTGAPLIAGLDSVLISSLRGGTGLNLGTISITDRNGVTGTVNFAGATSVSDIINDINNNVGGAKVTASLNASGTGIQLTDTSGGTGNLVVTDDSSTTAAELGIAGTFAASTVQGTNLQHQYVSDSTLLSQYNGGQGVALGQFQITNSKGTSATVDLTTGTYNTIGDVIQAINAKNIGVTASINANGNGILLTDTAGGPQKLKVTDLGGVTAQDLNIAGTASGTGASDYIDGGLQKTITVTDTDTLATLQQKINQAGFAVTANIINDGSQNDPYRLSLTATNSGEAGRVLISTGTTNLQMYNLVNAQDAAVFYGGTGNSQPLLITSNSNQLSNIISGVQVNLLSASSSPVTLSVTPDSSGVATQLANFTNDFNTVVTTISQEASFNTTTNEGGILLGDSVSQQIQQNLYNLINQVLPAGTINNLADVGISITQNASLTGATLTFNTNTFESAFASNPSSVQNFFSQGTNGFGTVIANAMDQLTDPVNGVITLQDNSLNTTIQDDNTQITNLNAILAEKKEQLQTEFNYMEQTLAQLQSQQQLISAYSSSGKTSTSSGSTSSIGSGASSSSSSSSSGSSSTSGSSS